MAQTVAQVIGANVRKRRIEACITLDTLASLSPLAMSTGQVGNIEAGRAAPTLETLYAIAVALHRATGQPVTFADLLDGDGDVSLGDRFDVEASTLRSVLRGQSVSRLSAESQRKLGKVLDEQSRAGIARLPEWTRLPKALRRGVDPQDWLRVERNMRENDERMCKNIGVDRDLGALLMTRLWNRPFTDERDHRAGPAAKAQRKGQVSRQLKAQLQKAIRDGG
jgi:transcriptional regulator with XRE-family HTH domain